jgi:hypothetical protein
MGESMGRCREMDAATPTYLGESARSRKYQQSESITDRQPSDEQADEHSRWAAKGERYLTHALTVDPTHEYATPHERKEQEGEEQEGKEQEGKEQEEKEQELVTREALVSFMRQYR